MLDRFEISTRGQGLYEVSAQVVKIVQNTRLTEGLCTIFIQHTSASLIIQENADPSARHDLERWLNRLVPERDTIYTHTAEGDDDMPAHIKAALTCSSIGIPIEDSRLCLGTWQGIYVWEHRKNPHRRCVLVHSA